MVSVLAFYSDDPSSNPAEAYIFSIKNLYEKNLNKEKQTKDWPIFETITPAHFKTITHYVGWSVVATLKRNCKQLQSHDSK